MLKKFLLPALLLFTAAVAAASWNTRAGAPARLRQDAAAEETSGGPYLRRAQLWPRLRETLDALGDRLEVPSKERLALAGELRKGDAPPIPFNIVRELPDRLRCELHEDGRTWVLVFDGRGPAVGGRPLGRDEEGLMEALVYDTVEHLLTARQAGATVRFLGPRFRLDEEGEGYEGPFYDLYQVSTPVRTGGEARLQPKVFYVNSDTFILDRVRYTAALNGGQVLVEVLLEGWRPVQGQLIPTRIVRLENGEPSMTLTVTHAQVGPAAADNAFTPQTP